MNAPSSISGLWVAMTTKIDERGNVERNGLVERARYLMANGCSGIVLCGTTGEGPSFTGAERLAALQALLDAGIPVDSLCLGAGSAASSETVATVREALGVGVTRALIVPPFFYKDTTDDDIASAFSHVLDEVNDPRLRAILYHIPRTTGIQIAPGIVAALASRFGDVIAGVKDSSGSIDYFRSMRSALPGMPMLVGYEPSLPQVMAEGAAGSISGMANIVPELVADLYAGKDRLAAIGTVYEMFPGQWLPLLKAVVAEQSGDAGWCSVRPPYRAASLEAGQKVAARLAVL